MSLKKEQHFRNSCLLWPLIHPSRMITRCFFLGKKLRYCILNTMLVLRQFNQRWEKPGVVGDSHVLLMARGKISIPTLHHSLFLNRKTIKELVKTLNKSPQQQRKLKRRTVKLNRNHTCWQGGQNHSPSGIIIKGGRRQAVWYPLSHESHNKICANKMNHEYVLAFITQNKLQSYFPSQHRSTL